MWVLGIEPVSTARAKCALTLQIYTEFFLLVSVHLHVCVNVWVYMPQRVSGGQRATSWRSSAPLMFMWVWGSSTGCRLVDQEPSPAEPSQQTDRKVLELKIQEKDAS